VAKKETSAESGRPPICCSVSDLSPEEIGHPTLTIAAIRFLRRDFFVEGLRGELAPFAAEAERSYRSERSMTVRLPPTVIITMR
jgi:hypothetical protein